MPSCKSCNKPALSGKEYCLDHHKDQSTYAYGLDYELQKKMAGKWDENKARLALDWLKQLSGKPVTGNFHTDLKDGVVLCHAINAIWPGSVASVKQSSMPFVQRENIVAYLDACRKHGLRETDLFVTQNLFEGENLHLVVDNICALGQLATTKGFKGPQLVITHGHVEKK